MSIVKHTAWPATAEEILSAVGVTEADRKAVDRMFSELGYGGATRRARAAAPAAKASSKVKVRAKAAAKKATLPKSGKNKKATAKGAGPTRKARIGLRQPRRVRQATAGRPQFLLRNQYGILQVEKIPASEPAQTGDGRDVATGTRIRRALEAKKSEAPAIEVA